MAFYILDRTFRHHLIKASEEKDVILLSEEKVKKNWSFDDPHLVDSTVRKNNETIVDKSFRDSKTSTEECCWFIYNWSRKETCLLSG